MKFFRNSSLRVPGGYSNGLSATNLTFKKVVKKVMRDRSYNEDMVQIENMFRRIVQEEINRLIQPYISSLRAPLTHSGSETHSLPQRFKLRFINAPPSSIFTGAKIKAKDGSPLLIELFDAATNARVVTGPLSSSRVEIVPLNADFVEEIWTVDGFKRNILKQREGKRPLLTGDLTVTLKDGVGVVARDVAFTDSSCWTRSRKFRLGGRLIGGGAVEARSEAFKCKDQRGESYKKHHPPYPGDDVWRLEKIAKDGVLAMRLHQHEITTVKAFRRLYATNPNVLYRMLSGEMPISKRTWEAIVSHAKRCVLDETECYIYKANTYNVSLLFNSVYEVIKVMSFNNGAFQNADYLTSYQLDQLKFEAYKNLDSFMVVDGRTFTDHFVDDPQRSLHWTQDPGFGIACPELQLMDIQGSSGPSEASMSLYPTSPSSLVQPEMQMSFENPPAAPFHVNGNILPNLRNSLMVSEQDPVHGESQTVATRDWIEKKENGFGYYQHNDMPNWSPGATNWAQQAYDSLCVSVTGTEEAGMYNVRIANIVGSPRARWFKIKAAFKLCEVWRHTTARNRSRGKACKKPCLQY